MENRAPAPLRPPTLRLDLVGAKARGVSSPVMPPGPAVWHRASAVLDYADGSWCQPVCGRRPFQVAAVTDESPDVLDHLCPECYPDA